MVDAFRVVPEKLDDIRRYAEKVGTALTGAPADERIFALSMATAEAIRKLFPDPRDADAAFQGFMVSVQVQLESVAPTKRQ